MCGGSNEGMPSTCPRMRVCCALRLTDQNSSHGSQVWRPSPCEASALGEQGSHEAERDISSPGSGSGRAEIVPSQSCPRLAKPVCPHRPDLPHPFTSSQVPPNPPSPALPLDGDSHPLPWCGVPRIGRPLLRVLQEVS